MFGALPTQPIGGAVLQLKGVFVVGGGHWLILNLVHNLSQTSQNITDHIALQTGFVHCVEKVHPSLVVHQEAEIVIIVVDRYAHYGSFAACDLLEGLSFFVCEQSVVV